MQVTLRTDAGPVLNKSDASIFVAFPARWLGVVSWLQRVSNRREALLR
jgi:hypothetical protein